LTCDTFINFKKKLNKKIQKNHELTFDTYLTLLVQYYQTRSDYIKIFKIRRIKKETKLIFSNKNRTKNTI